MLSLTWLKRALGFAVLMVLVGGARAQTPPDAPVITEPAADGQVVNPSDVHMETQPMHDADAGDTHECTDFEIWTVSPAERVWFTSCITGIERVHTHLGDGAFEGSYAGRRDLKYDTSYKLRIRFRDSSGSWSNYAERSFSTSSSTAIAPMLVNGVATTPEPAWTDVTDTGVILPGGANPAVLRLDLGDENELLELRGKDGVANEVLNPGVEVEHAPLRIVISGGSSGASLPASRLGFTDMGGADRAVYLPAMNVAPGASVFFWASLDGSTYRGAADQDGPDFSDLAQGGPVPWNVVEPGYKVEVVASGFQLPVNIAFVPEPGSDPEDPYFYVTELYGNIKVVTRGGDVRDYATDLLNYDPTGIFPGSGEQGLSGIAVDPISGDVFAAMLYDASPPSDMHYPKVVRFRSSDGGLTASSQTTILDMPGETQGQSHFVSSVDIGPDGKLYVDLGDGFTAGTALKMDSFRGKVLRMNLDGSAPADNPFYDASDGVTAPDYIYAYGFRNPFGAHWRLTDGALYEVENGPDTNDRFARVEEGQSYGWDGTSPSMTTKALYNWRPPHAPVDIAFIEPGVFGGSGFPDDALGDAFITESGSTWGTGPQLYGKRIVRFDLDPAGQVLGGPHPVIEYGGSGKASASAIAAGPDGLYFADLYKDQDYNAPTDRGANILRITFVGTASFDADAVTGLAPLAVQFVDHSSVPGSTAWLWDFGDGATSTEQSPSHTYTQDGIYNVRLRVTGANGAAVAQRNGFVLVGNSPVGLRADYFNGSNFTGTSYTRIDPNVDFDWGEGAPMPGMQTNNFSVRWTGQLESDHAGNYTFYVTADDGVRLWVNGEEVIDQWKDQSPTEYSGTISLRGGQRYNVKMEYYEHTGGAVSRLYWAPPGKAKSAIPQSRLYPVTGDVLPQPPPLTIGLTPSYPNPFSGEANVSFAVPENGYATLVLYNLLGQEVRRLFDGVANVDELYEFRIAGAGLPSGLYFLHLNAGGQTFTQRLVHVGMNP